MKLGLISDIHGEPAALELAWEHLIRLGAEQIVSAGDVVGYGPMPDQAMAFLIEHAIDSARGNHDRWALIRGEGEPDPFRGGTLSSETYDHLRRLPFDLVVPAGNRVGVIVHGSPYDDMEFVTRSKHPPHVLDSYLHTLKADFLVIGHTHEPMIYRGPHGIVVNPGSLVCAPVVNTSRTFALLETDTLVVSFHDVNTGEPVEVQPWRLSAADG